MNRFIYRWCVTFLVLVVGGACNLWATDFEAVEPAKMYEASILELQESVPVELKVMTWNIKFAGARIDFSSECHGERVLMEEDEVHAHLQTLITKIRQVDPDLLFIQEVDVGSKRSAYVDMVQYLLDATELNYAAYAAEWRASFLPVDGLGRMDTGNAVLSRWAIGEATRLALPGSDSVSELSRTFEPKRNMLRAKIQVPGFGIVVAVNVHVEGYGSDAVKKSQLEALTAEIDRLNQSGAQVVTSGTLHALPPGSEETSNFADTACHGVAAKHADYEGETEWLKPLYEEYRSAVPLDSYQSDPKPHYTHSATLNRMWTRKLDYIFTNLKTLDGSGLTHQAYASGGMDTMPMSDHAPVTLMVIPK